MRLQGGLCCDTLAWFRFVMVELGPTIHPTACSGVRGWLDPRDQPEDDRVKQMFGREY